MSEILVSVQVMRRSEQQSAMESFNKRIGRPSAAAPPMRAAPPVQAPIQAQAAPVRQSAPQAAPAPRQAPPPLAPAPVAPAPKPIPTPYGNVRSLLTLPHQLSP